MSEWREIWQEALSANRQMLRDERHSEKAFSDVLNKYRSDGMVYYELAEAYELSENYDAAINNYEKAKRLFPVPHWKAVANLSIDRVNNTIKKKQLFLSTPEEIQWNYFHKFHSLVFLPENYARYNSISAIAKIDSDPDTSISTFRKALEISLKELLNFSSDSKDKLELLINLYAEKYGDEKHIKPLMHNLRTIGNEATHSLDSVFPENVWKECLKDYYKIMKQLNENLKTQDYYI